MGAFGLPLLLIRQKWVNAYGRLWGKISLKMLKHIVGLEYEVRGKVPTQATIIANHINSAIFIILI